MADDEQKSNLGDFPNGALPCVFADGAMSAAWGQGVVKIYFSRYDPHLRGQGGTIETPIAQLVMPIQGFEATTRFFANTLERMAAAGLPVNVLPKNETVATDVDVDPSGE